MSFKYPSRSGYVSVKDDEISIGAAVISSVVAVLVGGIVSLIMGLRVVQWFTNVEFSRLFIIGAITILVLTVIIKKLF